MSLCIGVFAWCGFAEATRGSALLDRKKIRYISLIPLAVPICVVIANCWNHLLFYLDEQGAYTRGIMFQFEMGFLLVYSLVFSVRLVQFSRFETDPTRKSHLMLTASFPLCILAAWILSFVGESVPVICVCITIELLCLYMATTNQQISLDKLTQVNNRQNLYGYMDYKLKNHTETLFLMMIDVDYFKQINDTYGHLEGDAALIRVASALKIACGTHKKRPYIARYGGDEFIVLLEGTQPEAVALSESIRSNLKQLNQGSPYALDLTIGYAVWRSGMDGNALIDAADQKLYELKRAR
jgi:diguanylate cyclase (GGDEF)-like protein